MTSYVIELKQCPSCGSIFKYFSLATSNTLNAIYYTDGYIGCAMYSDSDVFQKCPNCRNTFLTTEFPIKESVRESEYFQNESLISLPESLSISASDYVEQMKNKIWENVDQEKYFRIRAWWSFNDVYRYKSLSDLSSFILNVPDQLLPENEANLLKLLELLDVLNESEAITKAEILRQLGRFDECLDLLNKKFDDNYLLPHVNTIKNLANNKNRFVSEVAIKEN